MPKCLVCNKKGIFLKVTNGLCPKCLETAQRQIIAANAARSLTSAPSPVQSFNHYAHLNTAPATVPPVERKLTYSEKELLAVQRTTMQDMNCLVNFPYVWNCRLEKSMQANAHPFVFMDIIGSNLIAARSELDKMNLHIEASKLLCHRLPKSLSIPVSNIVFVRSQNSSYSRLICSPVTYDGKLSKHPITLSFFTDMEKNETTHGDLIYGQSGNIEKATVYFWRRETGYFLYFNTVDNNFILEKIECTAYGNVYGCPGLIYEAPHLIAHREQLIRDEADFAWIRDNLPTMCPANITGYRRMRTQNTKNFQALKQAASELGYKLS